MVEAGSYRLELHHLADLGDDSAPEQTDPASGVAYDAATVELTAQMNCLQCDFSGRLPRVAELRRADPDRIELNGARVLHTTFRGAKMAYCHFIDLFSLYPGQRAARHDVGNGSDRCADFTGAWR